MKLTFIFWPGISLAALLMCLPSEAGEKLAIRRLAQGAFSAIDEARSALITNEISWKELWRKHTARVSIPGEAPKVDFAKEMVIIAALGRQRTGGYAVEIASVESDGKKLTVTIKKTKPRAGAITIQSLTAPFHYVAVPKVDLPAQFVEVEAEARR